MGARGWGFESLLSDQFMMTDEEKLDLKLSNARLLSLQGRWAEAKNHYENIIAELRNKPKLGENKREDDKSGLS